MPSLETEVAGIRFPNPFILASGPPTANGSMISAGFDAGWGGAVLKTVALEPTPMASPRVHILRKGRQQRGMVNIELITDIPLDRWRAELDIIRASHPTRPVIVSVMGGGHADDWQEAMRRLESHGVTAYELNVSCPNYSEHRGAQLGQDPEALAEVIGWAKEGTDLPVWVKLTPNVTDIVALARVAEEAGADAVTSTNTLSGLAGIDLESFSPLPAVSGVGICGGYSGPGLKPVSLRATASIARELSIPVIGCGGIETWEDAAEYVAVGASAVQVCTAAMWRGYELAERLSRGLERYLDASGYDSPADFRGRALANIVQFPDLDLSVKRLAAIEPGLCNGCGLCVTACASGGYQAIEMVGDGAVIDSYRCDGCGLCVGICPPEAITMVPLP
jgi:dihydropyrimidine dehydrogenase (NAD+) subunit PreA